MSLPRGLVLGLAVCLGACGGSSTEPRQPSQVVAEVSPSISTVVNVHWTTGDACTGYVEYGRARELGLRTPVEAVPTTHHTVALLGLTAETDYYYRAVTSDGSTTSAGAIARVTTGVLPPGLPTLTRTGDGQSQFIVVPIAGTNHSILIINGQGEIVWYRTDARPLDFFRARLSVDGKSLLYNAAQLSGDPSAASEIVRVALDGSQVTSIPVPYLAHDFVELPDGTLAAIAFETRDSQGTTLHGNKLVEVAPDGTLQTVWTTWDCFDPASSKTADALDLGWGFANALDYDAAQDVYYLSLRNFSSIARINRRTAACEWVLGPGVLTMGGVPTLAFAPGSARFLHEHQFQVRGDHLLVMDNDGAGKSNGTSSSRILEYQLDLTNGVATQVWSYTANPSVYAFVLGEPLRFDDGSTFINWGAAGQLERLNSVGTSIWQLNTELGYVFGFHTLADSLYSAGALPAGLSGT